MPEIRKIGILVISVSVKSDTRAENLPLAEGVSPEISYLHKVQVNRSGSSVQTEKVKLHRKREVGAYSKIFVC